MNALALLRFRYRLFAPASWFIVLALAVLAACDGRELTVPQSPANPRPFVSAPVGLGMSSLPAPPTSAPADVLTYPSVPMMSPPESTWVVVTVDGSISAEHNPACDPLPPNWACGDGPAAPEFDSGPGTNGPVQLVATQGGSSSAVRLRRLGGGSAVGLYFQRAAGPLMARLNLNAVYAYDPNIGTTTASYLLGGRYNVTATAVPAPFSVTESAPDADGVVTYTVEPLYGLQLTSPVNGWPAGATFWAFYPGDSLPDRPDLSWPGWQIPECQFKLVCQWKPPVAGRMQVLAHLEDQPAYARSKAMASPPQCGGASGELQATITGDCSPPSIEVVCKPNPVPRGGLTQCEANSVPHGDLQVTRWWFDDGAGHIIRSHSADEDSSFYWGGSVVIGGTVYAEGTIDGRPAPAGSTILSVIPRDWRFQYPQEPAPVWDRGDSLVYPPVHAYGERIGDGVLGKFWGGAVHTSAATLAQVGPNGGVSYIVSASVEGPLEIRINAGLQQDDPWYRAQRGRSPSHPNGCGREFLDREAGQVPLHESGHYAIERDFWTDKATADAFERAVGFPPNGSAALVAVRDSLVGIMKARQAKHDSTDFGIQDCDPYPLPRR